MPNIGRRALIANLEASLQALPGVSPEAVFKAAVHDAGLKDKPFYTPEETARVGRAVMAQAAAQNEAALADVERMLAQLAPDQVEG